VDFKVHETAIVDIGAQIGPRTRIWHWVHICPQAKIGSDCSLGQNVFIGNNVNIGNNVKIQNNVSIYDNVFIEDNVFCGPSMVFTNVFNPRSEISRKDQYRDTTVRKGVTLGANCTIVCGVTIGQYAFVGAGAVITKDVLPFSLMMGVPAKRVGWMSRYGERLHFKNDMAFCEHTGEKYHLQNDKVELLA